MAHQFVIGLGNRQYREIAFEPPAAELAPTRFGRAVAHLGDGHEGDDNRTAIDQCPVFLRRVRVPGSVDHRRQHHRVDDQRLTQPVSSPLSDGLLEGCPLRVGEAFDCQVLVARQWPCAPKGVLGRKHRERGRLVGIGNNRHHINLGGGPAINVAFTCQADSDTKLWPQAAPR